MSLLAQGDRGAGSHGAGMQYVEPGLLIALSVSVTILMVVPWGGAVLTALAPLPMLLFAVKYPWGYTVSMVGLESALCWSAGGLPSWLLFAQYNLPSLVMAGIIRSGGSMAQTIAGGTALPLLGAGVLGGLYTLVAQEPLSTLYGKPVDYIVQAAQDSLQLLAQSNNLDENQLRLVRTELEHLVSALFPAMLVMHYGLMNTLHYLLARCYCRHIPSSRHLEPADVTCWRSWEYLVWVFLGSGAALFIPVTAVSTVALNVFLITLAIYCMHGVAIALFWGRRVPLPAGVRMFLVVMVCMVAGPLCIVGCTAAGLFDLWVDFRRLRRPLAP